MGFGILFIGYFFLLNLSHTGYTDIISALIMFMAFYKLQTVNKYFRLALIPTGLFCAVSLVELFELLLSTLGFNFSFLIEYTAAPRYLLIGLLSVYMLMGIESVADEVDVQVTRLRAKFSLPFAYILFALGTIFEFPFIGNLIPEKPLMISATVLLFAIFIIMILNLVTIYSAYMHICMPEDIDNDSKEKKSKYGFVNKFKDHELEKNREYAEYKLNKSKEKASKKKRKK